MKIVKELDSSDFVKRLSPGYEEKAYLIWGLGDDGNLYARYSLTGYHSVRVWMRSDFISFGLTIGEMKRIIDAFGNLLPFI